MVNDVLAVLDDGIAPKADPISLYGCSTRPKLTVAIPLSNVPTDGGTRGEVYSGRL
jgi:hypothetical protein